MKLFLFLFSLLLVVSLPLVGIFLAGKPLADYLEFPPLTQYVRHADFSYAVFFLLVLVIIVATTPFIVRIFSFRKKAPLRSTAIFSPHFPLWGWLSILSCIFFWSLAWTRFEWFSFLQPYTFSPLWISYIAVVNAATFARQGRCMMTEHTGYFLSLFPASAVFWWYFEYLNRFVQNWHYIGAEIFSTTGYVVFATLCFSTVLPAVLCTCEFLETFPSLTAGLGNFFRLKLAGSKAAASIVLILSCAGLAGIGIYPDYLFQFLWLSPLLIISSVQILTGRNSIFTPVEKGDWSRIILLALSALICGFFWEMWNYHSLPKWAYSVPFVNRFRVFEMPLIGYAGYLPFGIECAVIGGILYEILFDAGIIRRAPPATQIRNPVSRGLIRRGGKS